MRLAFCIKGISFLKKYRTVWGKKTSINFERSIENYISYLLTDLSKKYQIDFFISTYNSPKNELLLKTFKPKKSLFKDYIKETIKPTNKRRFQIPASSTLEVLNLVEEYEKENSCKYDYIIITRFDLLFNKKFNDFNINNNAINILFQTSSKNVDDNFYFMPRCLLDTFLYATNKVKEQIIITHELNKYIPKNNLHIIYPQHYYSPNNNPYYIILR